MEKSDAAKLEELKKRVEFASSMNRKLRELDQSNGLVGMKYSKLEAMLGKPTKAEGNQVIYYIDSGFGGLEWHFQMRGDIVTKVWAE